MVHFLALPQEIRDFIYASTIDKEPLSIQSPHLPAIVVGATQGLSQANRQIRSEYLHTLKRHASLICCFDKTSIGIHADAAIAYRTRKLFLVVDLTDIKHTTWDPKKPEQAIGEALLQLITHVQDFIAGFRSLDEIEIQWWVDLSVARDRVDLGVWTQALIDVGLVERSELWYGYLGGIMKEGRKLRKHLVETRKENTRKRMRKVGEGGFKLVRGAT